MVRRLNVDIDDKLEERVIDYLVKKHGPMPGKGAISDLVRDALDKFLPPIKGQTEK